MSKMDAFQPEAKNVLFFNSAIVHTHAQVNTEVIQQSLPLSAYFMDKLPRKSCTSQVFSFQMYMFK